MKSENSPSKEEPLVMEASTSKRSTRADTQWSTWAAWSAMKSLESGMSEGRQEDSKSQ